MPDDTDLPVDDADRRVTDLLNSMTAGDLELIDPPADVWAGIEAELGLSSGTPTVPPTDGSTADAEPAIAAGAPIAPVIDLASRRRRMAVRMAAVAAAVAVIAGLAVVITADDAGGPIEVANASLEFDPEADFDVLGEGASATATLLDSNGAQSIRIDTAALPTIEEDADLELWLLGVNGEEIETITLGLVADPDQPGVYEVPADFDRDAFEAVAVDISIEPHDGDEAHSGRSIVRGPLTFA